MITQLMRRKAKANLKTN